MAREDYNACMVPWIKGREGLIRRLSFCVGAKICSGKAKTEDEAKQICNERFASKGLIQGGTLFNCKCLYDYDKEILVEALSSLKGEKSVRAGELINYVKGTPNCGKR